MAITRLHPTSRGLRQALAAVAGLAVASACAPRTAEVDDQRDDARWADLVAEVAEHGAVGLAELHAHLLAVGVVGLGDVDGDDAVALLASLAGRVGSLVLSSRNTRSVRSPVTSIAGDAQDAARIKLDARIALPREQVRAGGLQNAANTNRIGNIQQANQVNASTAMDELRSCSRDLADARARTYTIARRPAPPPEPRRRRAGAPGRSTPA